MININENELKIILDILEQYVPAGEVWAFGSRQRGTNKKNSDLDLAVVGHGQQPLTVMGNLKEAFMESTLPYRVDVLDYQVVTSNFRKIIDAEHEVF
jgi:predicted nucleotidyltransferase